MSAPTQHCCTMMTSMVNRHCEQHHSIFDCPDALICYTAQSNTYGLILHDGGTSYIQIQFCPWCGTTLPAAQENLPPMSLGGASLLFFVVLDSRHTYTGNTKHYVANQLLGPISALAICQYDHDPGYYLFGCDLEWNTITDTYHEICDDAFEQASFEYAGLERHHWRAVNLATPPPANDET